MIVDLSGRSDCAAGCGSINAGGKSAFSTGLHVGTSVFNVCITSIVSLKPGRKSLLIKSALSYENK